MKLSMILFFQSAYNCFTMLCQFLLYSSANQPSEYMYRLPLEPLPHPPPCPTPLGRHRARSSLCCAAASPSCLCYGVECACRCFSPSSPRPLLLLGVPASLLSTSVSLFPPCRQVHQYHFSRHHRCALIYYICWLSRIHCIYIPHPVYPLIC